jgi:hypothetical protein
MSECSLPGCAKWKPKEQVRAVVWRKGGSRRWECRCAEQIGATPQVRGQMWERRVCPYEAHDHAPLSRSRSLFLALALARRALLSSRLRLFFFRLRYPFLFHIFLFLPSSFYSSRVASFARRRVRVFPVPN